MTTVNKLMSEVDARLRGGKSSEWPVIRKIERDQQVVEFSLHIPPNTRWFEGHFVDQPIFPGVAQVFWAEYFAREEFSLPECGYQIKSLKFINMLLPNEDVQLHIENMPEKESWKFKFYNADGIFSSGTVALTSSPE